MHTATVRDSTMQVRQQGLIIPITLKAPRGPIANLAVAFSSQPAGVDVFGKLFRVVHVGVDTNGSS